MSNVLIVADHDGETLNPCTAKAVACAKTVPDSVIDVVLFVDARKGLADEASEIDGVRKVLVVSHAGFEHPLAAAIAPQIVAMAAEYTHVLGSSTTFGKDLMPRVAALLGVNQVSDVMGVEGSHSFRRPIMQAMRSPRSMFRTATLSSQQCVRHHFARQVVAAPHR